MRTKVTVPLVAMLMLAGTAAQGSVVEYTFTGTVGGEQDNAGLFGPPGTETLTGDTYTATFEVNVSGASSVNGNQDVTGGTDSGTPSPILSDTLTINGHTVSGIGGYIDSASVQAGAQFEVSASAANRTWLVFSVSGQSAGLPFQSLSAPLTYSVNGDAVGSFYLFDSTGQIAEDVINLNPTEVTISPAPVPLPAAIWLMLGGLGCCGVFVRIKRRAL